MLAKLADIALPRVAWRLHRDHDWLFTAADTASVLEELHRLDVDKVTVVAATGNRWGFASPYEEIIDVAGPDLAAAVRQMFVLRH